MVAKLPKQPEVLPITLSGTKYLQLIVNFQCKELYTLDYYLVALNYEL